jgi:hypothetical protein
VRRCPTRISRGADESKDLDVVQRGRRRQEQNGPTSTATTRSSLNANGFERGPTARTAGRTGTLGKGSARKDHLSAEQLASARNSAFEANNLDINAAIVRVDADRPETDRK